MRIFNWINQCGFSVLLLLCIVCQSAYADCRADVKVGNKWEEQGGFVQKATLNVKAKSDKPDAYVTVKVTYAFHYEMEDGWSNSSLGYGSVSMDLSDHSSQSFVIEIRVSPCSEDEGKSCHVNDVSIEDVDCYD